MESKVHKRGIIYAAKKFTRCKKEVPLDKRRVDLQCQTKKKKVNVEIKRNWSDYLKSQNQICDMIKSANKRKQAQLTMLAEPKCFIGGNKEGNKIIQSKGLIRCKMILA